VMAALLGAGIAACGRAPKVSDGFADHGIASPVGTSAWGGTVATADADGRLVFIKMWSGGDTSSYLFIDAETGETVVIDTSDPALMNMFASQTEQERLKREKLFKSMNIDFIDIYTNESYVEPLVKFFRMRAKRFH